MQTIRAEGLSPGPVPTVTSGRYGEPLPSQLPFWHRPPHRLGEACFQVCSERQASQAGAP